MFEGNYSATTDRAVVKRVKHGDRRDVRWSLGVNLTGCTVSAQIARSVGGTVQILTISVDEPATDGIVTHTLDGTLDLGEYLLEFDVEGPDGTLYQIPTNGFGRLIVETNLG